MIDLTKIAVSAPAPSASVDVSTLVAEPGFAPRGWQSPAPDSAWMTRALPVGESDDLRRILVLPRRAMVELDSAYARSLVGVVMGQFARAPVAGRCRCAEIQREAGIAARPCITELKPVQAWALYEIAQVAGLLGPIGVGHGKTIVDLLAPLAMPACRLAVLLVPVGLIGQLVSEYLLLGQHFRVPELIVHGGSGPHRDWTSGQVPGAPVLHVLPYSLLSVERSKVFLERVQPDTIIADEVHKLRHADTATTSRVLRYFHGHPRTRFCGWSGSITDSSVKDYAHLAALALRAGSPLPLDPEVVEDWARALDPSDLPAPAGSLMRLCAPGEHLYDGFRRRLRETAGVVSTTTAAVDVELSIDERPAPDVPEPVARALDHLRATWERPDGEELVDALTLTRCAREIACGFYYRWRFPHGEPAELIEEWLVARKLWHQELRWKLKDRREHLDSPLLCTRAAMRAWGDDATTTPGDVGEDDTDPTIQRDGDDLPYWRAAHWPRWREVRRLVHPESEAVRLHDYLVQDAAAWGLGHRGIVWYESAAFGAWVAEVSGLPLHTGGPEAGQRLAAERGDRSIVASIKAHGTGRDGLQYHFGEQLIGQPPASATAWEQLLGRLHRHGQHRQRVTAEFYRHTEELRNHVDTALARALYVQGTIGAAQKLRTGFRIG